MEEDFSHVNHTRHFAPLVVNNDNNLDERSRGPQPINVHRVDPTKPNPKSGAAQLDWNKTGTLLLVRFGMLSSYALTMDHSESWQRMCRHWCTSMISLLRQTHLCHVCDVYCNTKIQS